MLLTIIITIVVLMAAVAVIKMLWPAAERPSEPPVHHPAAGAPTIEEIQHLAKAGKKIEAIKLYRELHDVGLAEAKDAVEKMASE